MNGMQTITWRNFIDERHLFIINGMEKQVSKVYRLRTCALHSTCKKVGSNIIQITNMFFTLIVYKQTGGKMLQTKDIFFTLIVFK